MEYSMQFNAVSVLLFNLGSAFQPAVKKCCYVRYRREGKYKGHTFKFL